MITAAGGQPVVLAVADHDASVARDLFGAPSVPLADRRLKECAEALERFAEQVYQAREHGGPG